MAKCGYNLIDLDAGVECSNDIVVDVLKELFARKGRSRNKFFKECFGFDDILLAEARLPFEC